MPTHRLLLSLLAGMFWFVSGSALAIDADADRVDVRKTCPVPSVNCVTTMAEVNTWLEPGGRQQSPVIPVIIDVGPGEFDPFVCADQDSITLRGSGRITTTISNHLSSGVAVSITNCDRLELQDLRVVADGSLGKGVDFNGPGSVDYTDIEVEATRSPFEENDAVSGTCPYSASQSVHRSWNSIWRDLNQNGSYAWGATCTQALFYGSEVFGVTTAIQVQNQGDVRLYGSVVRTVVLQNSATNPARGVRLGPGSGGTFHMHGGLIAVDASAKEGQQNVSVLGIQNNTGFAHALDTAFLVKAAGTGTATRVSGASVEAPLLLAPGTDKPNGGGGGAGPYVSTTGQDLYVETDCCSNGDCNATPTPGTEPHLMVYNSNLCTNPTQGPWFDTVTGRCRGVVVGSCP
jgi:hypothetical protein